VRVACSSRPQIYGVLAAFAVTTAAADAADRWQEAGSGAVAILPAPTTTNGIESATLYCAEQKWAFYVRTTPGLLPAGQTLASKVTVNSQLFEGTARSDAGGANVPVPVEALAPLRTGSKLAVEIGPVETGVAAVYNLRGSRLVIDAIAPRCSPIDMSDYDAVVLSETDPAVDHVREVAADEIATFRRATGKEPTVSATILELAEQKRLMFGSICGSTNYYGASGCNLTGYAAIGALGEWRPVYNTEGLLLHTDRKASNGGWPNLVTLPVAGSFEPTHWAWAGSGYQLVEQIIAEDMPALAQGDAAE
jgi:hypothetical protein